MRKILLLAGGLILIGAHLGAVSTQGKQSAVMASDSIPGDTLPGDVLPNDTLPSDTFPNDTLPGEIIPGDTIPSDTIPSDTIPSDTIPSDTLPGDTLPVPGQEAVSRAKFDFLIKICEEVYGEGEGSGVVSDEMASAIEHAKALPSPNQEDYDALKEAYIQYCPLLYGEWVEVQVDVPGTLQSILEERGCVPFDMANLRVSGELNSDDVAFIQSYNNCFERIDLEEAGFTVLPDGFMASNTSLKTLFLPKNLEVINGYAFYESGVRNIVLPESLKQIKSIAFWKAKMEEIVIPDLVEEIEGSAFADCTALTSVKLPANLAELSPYVFQGCTSLTSINLPNCMHSIGYYAFENTGLEEIRLPDSLRVIGSCAFQGTRLKTVTMPDSVLTVDDGAFSNCAELASVTFNKDIRSIGNVFPGCTGLQTVTCLAFYPPYSSISLESAPNCVLYVPVLSVHNYTYFADWMVFQEVRPLNIFPENIVMYNTVNVTFPDSLLATYKPNVAVKNNEYGSSQLVVSGNATFQIRNFEIDRGVGFSVSFVNNLPVVADSVRVNMTLNGGGWSFISFPFDVRVADIKPENADIDWVIRKYSGADRAQTNMENTWQNMTQDSILKAGEGYIWHCANRGFSDGSCSFTLKALDPQGKNHMFELGYKQTLPLFASEYDHNKNWNLTGNPYPAFYDINFMEYGAPIIVWDEWSQNYMALSPADDGYQLRPFESFFVQCPDDMNEIGFPNEGKVVLPSNQPAPDMTARIAAKANSNSPSRKLFNLYLKDGELTDRTRIVFNDEADRSYELDKDAAKLFSMNPEMPQLYTLENGVKMAINERPYLSGEVNLAFKAGHAGTYTLSLNTEENLEVVLVDKKAGLEVALNGQDYEFEALAGTDTDRFVIRVAELNEGENTTGVKEQGAPEVSIRQQNGALQVVCSRDAAIEVYSADAVLIRSEYGKTATVAVKAGVYVVKVDGVAYKVAVTK